MISAPRALLLIGFVGAQACAYATPPDHGDVDAPGLEADAPVTQPDSASGAAITLSQSSSMAITAATSVGCIQANSSRQNSYYRVFRLADHGIAKPFAARHVDFGVQDAVGAQTLGVKLHVLAGTFTLDHLSTVASKSVPVDSTASGTMITVMFDQDVMFSVNDTLVAEVEVPDAAGTGNRFLLGANREPETQPGYVRSPSCGTSTPTAFAAVGFPDTHIVLTVGGRSDP
jgi:hypothetical protein